MRTTCKQCWKPLSKHRVSMRKNFCGKECNLKWRKRHKGSKKRREKAYERELMSYGSFDCDGNATNDI